jgi:flavin reductase (DIM6/NTAB) family NADH-FMN oxidoreductase RutF
MSDRLLAFRNTPFAVNILAHNQQHVAHAFAHPAEFPHPFDVVPHQLNSEGVPVIQNCIGSVFCKLLACIPMVSLEGGLPPSTTAPLQGESRLFLAKVIAVMQDASPSLPLLYHRRRYSSIASSPGFNEDTT